ncbi:MAG: hypothetical protein FWD17_07770 [Polyangiaceae bacterium]|nr:hypothetical protein [Polyangiaceae bacterium]
MLGRRVLPWSAASGPSRSRPVIGRRAVAAVAALAWVNAWSIAPAKAEPLHAPSPDASPTAPDGDPLPPLPPPAEPPRSPVSPLRVTAPAAEWPKEQEHRRYEGFYLRTSIGVDGMAAWGQGPSGRSSISGDGPSLGLGIGGSVTPGLAIGAALRFVDTNGRFRGSPYAHTAEPMADTYLVVVGVLADWYPNPDGGWHIGGEAGVGELAVTPVVTDREIRNISFGGAVLGGYDWRIRDSRWAFGIVVVASGIVASNLRDQTGGDAGYRMQGFATSVEGTALFF